MTIAKCKWSHHDSMIAGWKFAWVECRRSANILYVYSVCYPSWISIIREIYKRIRGWVSECQGNAKNVNYVLASARARVRASQHKAPIGYTTRMIPRYLESFLYREAMDHRRYGIVDFQNNCIVVYGNMVLGYIPAAFWISRNMDVKFLGTSVWLWWNWMVTIK